MFRAWPGDSWPREGAGKNDAPQCDHASRRFGSHGRTRTQEHAEWRSYVESVWRGYSHVHCSGQSRGTVLDLVVMEGDSGRLVRRGQARVESRVPGVREGGLDGYATAQFAEAHGRQ